MKRFLFIDNDSKERSNDYGEIDRVHDLFEATGLDYNKIEYEFRIDLKSRDEMLNLLFNPDNVIVTHSVYSNGGSQSHYQLFSFLTAAGVNRIKNQIYIDVSGFIVERLNRYIKDCKHPIEIIEGIAKNYILTNQANSLYRIEFYPDDSGYFHAKPFDIHSILK